MEAELVLQLLDSYWYDLDFFKRSHSSTKTQQNPQNMSSNCDIPTLPTIHTKSSFERMSSNSKLLSDSSPSPNSVLFTSKLQTIFSGKETKDFDDTKSEKDAQQEQETPPKMNSSSTSTTPTPKKANMGTSSRRRKKKGSSKSLSDLEFEELKGFMDLGFVFSEEDKVSSLATIIPGLQRLGNKSSNVDIHKVCDDVSASRKEQISDTKSAPNFSTVSRPYLSEAWEVLEKKKKEDSLLKWKVPAPASQINMKDYLKSWAHTVASTVR